MAHGRAERYFFGDLCRKITDQIYLYLFMQGLNMYPSEHINSTSEIKKTIGKCLLQSTVILYVFFCQTKVPSIQEIG